LTKTVRGEVSVQNNRWVRSGPWRPAGATGEGPTLPSLEVVYRTDPAVLAAVIPPPLSPPPEPRVHVRITEIDLDLPGANKYQEMVGYIATDVTFEGVVGEYPLLIPIDLEGAVAISRERFGEPKKLAEIALARDGNHVEGSITRDGVTFVEIVGEVGEPLPVPEPYPACQFWFKFLPSVDGTGFDAGPFLVRVDQVRSPQSIEPVDGKLVLRDLASAPVVDLPVEELVSITWTRRRSTHEPVMVGPVDPESFFPFAAARYDHV
jgi:acetoacetate decarboxylase